MPAAIGNGRNGLQHCGDRERRDRGDGRGPDGGAVSGRAFDAYVRVVSGAVAAVERVPEHRYSRAEYGHRDSGIAGDDAGGAELGFEPVAEHDDSGDARICGGGGLEQCAG